MFVVGAFFTGCVIALIFNAIRTVTEEKQNIERWRRKYLAIQKKLIRHSNGIGG